MVKGIAKLFGISLWILPFGVLALFGIGVLLKKSKYVNNELLPACLVLLSCFVCGSVAYAFNGDITTAILKYGLGLGFGLSGISTGGYSIVHGVKKFLKELKKRDEISEVKMNKKLLLKKWHEKILISSASIVGVAVIIFILCKIGAMLGIPFSSQSILAWCFAFAEGALIYTLVEEFVSRYKYNPNMIQKYYVFSYILSWVFAAFVFITFVSSNFVVVMTFGVLSIADLFVIMKIVNNKYLDWFASTEEGADEALKFGWTFWYNQSREIATSELIAFLNDNHCYLEKPRVGSKIDRQHKIAESNSGNSSVILTEYVKGVFAQYSFRSEEKKASGGTN